MNSVFAQYEELSSPQFAVINLSLRLRLITANFGLDNSSYRAQPHSIIVNYYLFKKFLVSDWLTVNCEIVISTQWRTKYSKMASTSQYEKILDAFAPYYYDDENHIDSLTPLI